MFEQELVVSTMHWQPKWTTPVKIESGGRYPLGLNRFHDHLEELLIKSIVNEASRLRHFSYCCWAIGDIEANETCQTKEGFVRAFRRRESALGMGLLLNNVEFKVAGSDRLQQFLDVDAIKQSCDFSMMQSNELGTFGLNYVGTTFNLGLISRNEKDVYVLTDTGKQLYRLMAQHYQRLRPSYYVAYRGATHVPTEVLQEWGAVNDYDAIRHPEHEAERQFFRTLILRLDQPNPADYRRDTFAFTLFCIDHCNRHDTPFDETVLQCIHLYNSYYDSGGQIVPFSASAKFDDMLFYWRIYEGQASFRGWLLRYFGTFTNFIKGFDDGATVDEFLASWDSAEFDDTINLLMGANESSWLEALFGHLADEMGSAGDLRHDYSEINIQLLGELETTTEKVAAFTIVLGNLWLRFKDVKDDERFQELMRNLHGDMWFYRLLHIPKLHALSTRALLRYILNQFVLVQHDLIMIEKHDLRRCWFTREEERYFHQADPNEIWRPAKFETIMGYLFDMNLVSAVESPQITSEGRQFLDLLAERFYAE